MIESPVKRSTCKNKAKPIKGEWGFFCRPAKQNTSANRRNGIPLPKNSLTSKSTS
jgi:hypothetical protein